MGELNWLPLCLELSKGISGVKGTEKEGVRCNALETKDKTVLTLPVHLQQPPLVCSLDWR